MRDGSDGIDLWMGANYVTREEAELLLVALGSPGDWGPFVVRRQGAGFLVTGVVSALSLSSSRAVTAFKAKLKTLLDE